MTNIVDIRRNKPHISGNAKCLSCNYEWIAVAEIGNPYLECPECELLKGVFYSIIFPNTVVACKCGCPTYYTTIEGEFFCSLCGTLFDYED